MEQLLEMLVRPSHEAQRQANTILDLYKDALAVDVCYLMNYEGTTIASSNRDAPDSFLGKNFAFRPYFQEAIHSAPATYLALGVTSKKRGVYHSFPIFEKGEDLPIGLVVIKASIELIDREDLYELHADFCSRLGMTFSHGDYAKNEFVQEKDETAEKLYRKALSYYPDHRAYLGLAILKQRAGEFKASIQFCQEGIKHFPDSPELGLCLGLSYMNLKDYQRALQSFQRLPDSKKAKEYIAICYRELGDR